MPTTSWPGTRGYWIPGQRPSLVRESLWQTPQAWTFTRTCPGPGCGISRSTSSKGALWPRDLDNTHFLHKFRLVLFGAASGPQRCEANPPSPASQTTAQSRRKKQARPQPHRFTLNLTNFVDKVGARFQRHQLETEAEIEFMKRTHHCNELRPANIGQTVILSGWVHSRRDLGGLIFIDVRDREGRTQTVFDPSELARDLFERASALRSECVVNITGKVRKRPPGTNNPKIPTGEIEVAATALEVLNMAEVLPFPVDDPEIAAKVNEELRLQYRYLDLRRPEMARNLRLRSKVATATRNYLDEQGFLEVETPILFKSTPEGAREFLGAKPQGAGQVLRPAAIATAIGADPYGGRRRTLFPTGPLLPGRGPARGPAVGVHAGGHRNVVHRARGHLRSRRRPAQTHLENRA